MPVRSATLPTIRHAAVVAVCAIGGVVANAAPASADLVTFATGRTMSVKAHRQEGDTLVLSLRGGGEMTVDASLVTAIGPDEVPYPEPAAPSDTVASAIPVAAAPILAVNATYDPVIMRVAAEQGVDASLVRAVIQVESGYQPRARSSKGAVGLMQVLPATARQYGVTNLYDPAANIRAGVSHLRMLLDRFPLALALAAYNAGEAAVERFSGIPPYPETVDYVSRIRALVGR
jgi:soluble lytic murein transglycosylase-like protein